MICRNSNFPVCNSLFVFHFPKHFLFHPFDLIWFHFSFFQGPRSLPPRMLNEYSPNESPSSSTDLPQERSFHSEFQSSAQGRRRSKHSMFSPSHRKSSQRRRHKDYRDSDSENNPYDYEDQLEAAMKQIKKYKTSLAEAIDEKRRLEREKTSLEIQLDEFTRSRRKYAHEIRLLREENMKMKQRVAVLENVSSLE